MGLIGLVVVTLLVTVIGGGIGLLFWYKSRPKKMSWTAKCYQVGEGIRPPIYDKKGVLISDLKLNDLIPYIEDRLERTEKAAGVIIYRLVNLNMTTNAVTADMVDVWGSGKKEVRVLIDGSTATLMKQGYDRKTSTEIFQPMSRERIELIKSEIIIKKDRLHKEKDILAAITPWIVAGMAFLAIVGVAYLMSEGFVKVSENLAESTDNLAETIKAETQHTRDLIRELNSLGVTTAQSDKNLGKHPEPPPPSVE